MTNTATIYVIDDDASVRNSLRMLMESTSAPVETYESAEAFLAAFDPERPGCIVLDLRMPGMGGMQLLQQLRASHSDIPMLIISGYVDVPEAIRLMKLGAIDVLQKPFEPQVLLHAVHQALADSVERQHLRTVKHGLQQRLTTLTPREHDLLTRVVAGMPNKRIAMDLNISIKTVANHRASLMAKTQALNAADLARMSIAAGVISGI